MDISISISISIDAYPVNVYPLNNYKAQLVSTVYLPVVKKFKSIHK